jgi:2-polyprenyl-6-methoxyphenol hydroxylase-like FAD-dependent oxidoreductase
MPPQGESTGIAIEDGVLIAQVLGRSGSRSVEQLFSDFEAVRRTTIEKHYKDVEKMGKMVTSKPPGFKCLIIDLLTMVFMFCKNRQQIDLSKSDVWNIALPV